MVRLGLGIERLGELGKVELVLLGGLEQLLGAGGSGIERTVMLLVRLGRRRVGGHLRVHPVLDLQALCVW